MTGTQLALLAGALIGLGVALLAWRLLPAQPHLTTALGNLAPEQALTRPPRVATTAPTGAKDRLGVWTMTHLPWLGRPRTNDLAILTIPVHRYYADKLILGLAGLLAPGVFATLAPLVGVNLPVGVPLGAALLLGAVLSLLPDLNVRTDARAARKQFSRALIAYMDLVALERNGGSGTRQAMEVAATIGDSWTFRRIGEELARSRWSGQPPWDALRTLAGDLELPELAEVGDIMRLAGEEGASVYETLRARSASMRTAVTNEDLARANEVGEQLTVPVTVLSLLFLVILVTPAVLRVFV